MTVRIEKELCNPVSVNGYCEVPGPYYHIYKVDEDGNKELVKTVDGDIKEAAREAERVLDFDALDVVWKEKGPEAFSSVMAVPNPEDFARFLPKQSLNNLLHPNTEVPAWWMDMGFIISREPGHISTSEIYFWDDEDGEFYGNITHHIPLDQVYGWVYVGELEDALFKKMDGDIIKEVHGFKVGDKVRLADGDGRTHIIKRFEEVEGLHSLNFYRVEFEDDTASDHIFPGQPYRTSMVKIED